MGTKAQPFICISGLSRRFRQGAEEQLVLGDASFTMERGETVALLGRSGSGKTTLLNLISGVDRAEQGSVVIDGIDLAALDERARTLFRRRHIGFIYQFFNLVPGLTAAENIALPLELNGVPLDTALARVHTLLESVGLEAKAGQFPAQLSGGEQQRIAILRALVHAPALVLADEPTGNLDAQTGAQMLAVLKNQLGRSGSTTLLVTHSLAVARSADRIVTLEAGGIQERTGDFAW